MDRFVVQRRTHFDGGNSRFQGLTPTVDAVTVNAPIGYARCVSILC
jgi:hypothetical protein